MIVSFLLGLAALAQQSDDLTITIPAQPRRSIMPAITVYLWCLHEARERLSQGAGPLRADGMRRVMEQAQAECAHARAEARAQAISIMNGDLGGPADPEGEVDRALAAGDARDEAFLQELARAEQAESPKR